MSALEDGITCVLDRGCPTSLAPVIRDFVTAICEFYPDQVVGVLLVGSASRGELSWQKTGEKSELFSDIEFLIGIDRHDRVRQAKVEAHAKQITETVDLGSFFHIDFTFIEWSRLGGLDTKFFIFESKACGIDLCSTRLAPLLPTTTRINLNFKELNEILVHRMSSIVHAIPERFFANDLGAQDNQQFALCLAKNTLDLTTWLHPYESENLVAGYGNRVNEWRQSGLKGLQLSNYFSASDLQYFQSCIALRQAPSTLADSRSMLQQTLDLYERAIQYCLHMNGIAQQRSLAQYRSSAKLFDEYRLRARVSQAVSVIRNTETIGLTRLLRNVVGVRRGLAVEICKNLVLSAVQWATDEKAAREALSRARKTLSTVVGASHSADTKFASQWLDTRALFAIYQQITRNY